MTLSAGARLGPYEITGALGAGGMGEVYRARDTRLGRDVAIKRILPQYAGDTKRRERFDREARSIARLTHPHIGALYDVGDQDGIHFLVLELVDGDTLAARLARGPLSLDESLAIAIQIGEALAAAHRQGIVHRDLKPGNIILARAGAKLMDFGLARLREDPDGADETATRSVLTDDRAVLGTLPYMAPEQLDGRTDERSDIFAFGAVAYEMITGRRAFVGESPSSVMASLLACNPPPVSTLQPLASPSIERAVRKCLTKDPDARWQSARDLTDELRWIKDGEAQAAMPLGRRAGAWRAWAAGALSVAAIGTIAVLATALLSRPASSPPESRLMMPLGADLQTIGSSMSLSPDATTVALSAGSGIGAGQLSIGGGHLYLRRLDSMTPVALGRQGSSPFFSPDGRWLGFFANGKLKKMLVSGGAPIDITDGAGTADWGAPDLILFSDAGDRAVHGIRRVSPAGGEVAEVTSLDRTAGQTHHLSPQLLPGGRAILYTIRSEGARLQMAVQSLSGGLPRVIQENAAFGRYIGDGVLIYRTGGSLFAAHFDETQLLVSGQVAMLDGVSDGPRPGWAYGAGTLVYQPAEDARQTLFWVARDGSAEVLGAPPRPYHNLRLSARGDRIAAHLPEGAGTNVWTYDIGPRRLEQLTSDGVSRSPAWSHDDSRLLVHRRAAVEDIFAISLDGSGAAQQVTRTGTAAGAAFMTKDGKTLVYHELRSGPAGTGYDLWIKAMGSSDDPRPLVQTPRLEAGGRLHPTERWMAYATNVTGRDDVFVTTFPTPGARVPVTTDGGREPIWSRDGRELFYRKDNKMFSVALKPGGRGEFEAPRQLFDVPYFQTGGPGNTQYDVAPDGRFLMMRRSEVPMPHLVVIQSWTARLKDALRGTQD